MHEWSWEKMPELNGKLVVITGANAGLGFETTRMLTARGARVVMGCRSVDKAEEAQAKIKAEFPYARLEFIPLDLANLASIRKFAEKFHTVYDRLDVLVNNAGVMAIPFKKTTDGFEMQFGTNHLGHFALTAQLFPLIAKTPQSRIVQVSSNAHKFGKMRFEDPNFSVGYEKWQAYGQSKLANLLFMRELSRRLQARKYDIKSVAAHPGYADTDLQMLGPRLEGSKLAEKAMAIGNKYFAQPAQMGALPIAYAASMPDVLCGEYFGPSGFLEFKGFPKRAEMTKRALNTADSERLWDLSLELTGVKFNV